MQANLTRKWFIASRAPFSITVVLPGFLGITGAWRYGVFDPVIAALTLVGLFFANLGTNFTNDYFDYKSGVDAVDEGRRYKPGAETLLADGLKPRVVLGSAFVCLGIASVCGAAIVVLFRPAILAFGLVGLFIAWFYTAPPFKFGYRGLGEVVAGIACGPLTVLGAYFAQTGTLTPFMVLISLPVGILVASILYIVNVPDADADAKAGKKTISVRFGRKSVRFLAAAFYAAAYAGIVAAGFVRPWVLIGLASLPLTISVVRITGRHYDDIHSYSPAIGRSVGVFGVTTVLLIVGLVFGGVLR